MSSNLFNIYDRANYIQQGREVFNFSGSSMGLGIGKLFMNESTPEETYNVDVFIQFLVGEGGVELDGQIHPVYSEIGVFVGKNKKFKIFNILDDGTPLVYFIVTSGNVLKAQKDNVQQNENQLNKHYELQNKNREQQEQNFNKFEQQSQNQGQNYQQQPNQNYNQQQNYNPYSYQNNYQQPNYQGQPRGGFFNSPGNQSYQSNFQQTNSSWGNGNGWNYR